MKTASIETVAEVLPHPNADRLELVKILGWQCVVRKGEFQAGQEVVFVVIDTILPDAPWSLFLKKGDKPIRLRTAKLRGQHSQGLVLPLSVLPEASQTWHTGADVGGELGIKKYEKEIPSSISGIAKCGFPQYLAPRTDEDNGLSYPELVAETLKSPCLATLKLDGCSCTVVVREGVVDHVCSRNLSLREDDKNAMWRIVRRSTIPIQSVVIQGEVMGPGIQGNQLGLTEAQLYVFQIKSLDQPWSGNWMSYTDMAACADLCGMRTVPRFAEIAAGTSLEDLQKLADTALLPDGKPAEGIVIRPQDGFYQRAAGNGRPLGFKLINRNYVD